MNKYLQNIIREELLNALKEEEIPTSPFTDAEEKFLAKFVELGTQSLGILYTKNEVGIREFLMRSGKDYNLTPDVLSKLMKDGIISIVPYGGYARNEDYTIKCNLPLDELEGLSSGDSKEGDDDAPPPADDAGDTPEPDTAPLDDTGEPQESTSSSLDLSKLLVSEQKRHTSTRVYTNKSRALRRLPKGYVVYLEKIIKILGQKLHTDLEKQHLVADILDNLAHNFGLTPKQVYKSFIFYNSQNRLKNVVREEINEQSNTVCKGNNTITGPIVKIYPKEASNFFPINFFMRINFGAKEVATKSYAAALASLKSQILDSPKIDQKLKTQLDNEQKELAISAVRRIRSAASNHFNNIKLQPTHTNQSQPLSTSPDAKQYPNGNIGSSTYNKNFKFAQGRWNSFQSYLKQDQNFKLARTIKNPKEELRIIDTGGCNDESREIASYKNAGQYLIIEGTVSVLSKPITVDKKKQVEACSNGMKLIIGWFTNATAVDGISMPVNDGKHQCDEATFSIFINNVFVGISNMNNGPGTFGPNSAKDTAIQFGKNLAGQQYVAPTQKGGTVYTIMSIDDSKLSNILNATKANGKFKISMKGSKGTQTKPGNVYHGDAPMVCIYTQKDGKNNIMYGPQMPFAGKSSVKSGQTLTLATIDPCNAKTA